jgi:exodeoxyribonuclease VII small subunit
MTFSESMKQVEAICHALEEETLPLEETLKLYKEGMEKLRECKNYLEQVEQEVLLVGENLELTPFVGEASQEKESPREENHD